MKKLFLVGLLLFPELLGHAQALKNKTSMGIFIRPGVSRGVNTIPYVGFNSYQFLSGSIGLYDLIRIKNENGGLPFYFIKTELALSTRKGVFEVSGFSLASIFSSSVDLTVILPATFKVSEAMTANIGIGGNLSYQLNKEVQYDYSSSGPPISDGSNIRPGIVLDIGFLFDDQATALFGVRTLYEYTKYPYAEIGIYFGFGIRKNVKK